MFRFWQRYDDRFHDISHSDILTPGICVAASVKASVVWLSGLNNTAGICINLSRISWHRRLSRYLCGRIFLMSFAYTQAYILQTTRSFNDIISQMILHRHYQALNHARGLRENFLGLHCKMLRRSEISLFDRCLNFSDRNLVSDWVPGNTSRILTRTLFFAPALFTQVGHDSNIEMQT